MHAIQCQRSSRASIASSSRGGNDYISEAPGTHHGTPTHFRHSRLTGYTVTYRLPCSENAGPYRAHSRQTNALYVDIFRPSPRGLDKEQRME